MSFIISDLLLVTPTQDQYLEHVALGEYPHTRIDTAGGYSPQPLNGTTHHKGAPEISGTALAAPSLVRRSPSGFTGHGFSFPFC